jgi:hypothetical protein
MQKCSIDSCEKPAFAKGLCPTDYQRQRRENGMPAKRRRKGSPRPKGAPLTYSGAHQRVRVTRGPASGYPCTACGEQASDWSLLKGYDPNQLTVIHQDGNAVPISGDPWAYVPLCRPCHQRLDHSPESAAMHAALAEQMRRAVEGAQQAALDGELI